MNTMNIRKQDEQPRKVKSVDQRSSLFRRLSVALVLLLVFLGGGYTLFALSPSWFRFPDWLPFPAGEKTSQETVQIEIPPIDPTVAVIDTGGEGRVPTLPIEQEPVLDSVLPEIKEQIDRQDQRLAFQGSALGEIEVSLETIREGQAGLERKLDEITTRLALREDVDMNTINGMVERQAFLEDRMNEATLHLDTRIEAVVGSLSLVKKQMASQEELIAGLSGDIYLLTRYGFGSNPRMETRGLTPAGRGQGASENPVPVEPVFKRGDYRVGDWIQGYGEVLSIHRTIEGDYLMTENGEIFAKADPEGETEQ